MIITKAILARKIVLNHITPVVKHVFAYKIIWIIVAYLRIIVKYYFTGGYILVDKIKALAAQKNLTIMQLEKACGIGKRTIYRWDKTKPSANSLKKVADYLGTTMESLMEVENHDN